MTTPNKMTELLPCAHCGGQAEIDDRRLCWTVECTVCGSHLIGDRATEEQAETATIPFWVGIRETAITAWNRRAPLAAAIDYKLLLAKYIEHVGAEEGSTSIEALWKQGNGTFAGMSDRISFTADEVGALRDCEKRYIDAPAMHPTTGKEEA